MIIGCSAIYPIEDYFILFQEGRVQISIRLVHYSSYTCSNSTFLQLQLYSIAEFKCKRDNELLVLYLNYNVLLSAL